MIVVSGKAGALGNRLFLFAHLIAFAIEQRIGVLNPSFDEYADDFAGTRESLACAFPPRVALHAPRQLRAALFAAARRISAFALFHPPPFSLARTLQDGPGVCDLASPDFAAAARRHPLLFLDGWLFRHRPGLQKHADAIRRHLTPIASCRAPGEAIVRRLRADADVVVGLHIRRGDYATFQNGRFFFSYDQYAAFMDRMARLLAPKRVAFVVCSNEPVPPEILTRHPAVTGPGNAVADLHALSLCDYILGPWSTFSGWASYHGNKPWLMLDSPRTDFTLQHFSDVHHIWATE